MGSKLFKRGFKESRQEAERQEARKEARKGQLWRLFLKDGEEVAVRFLTEEPVTFYEHNIKNGDRYSTAVCTGEDCPYCADGSPQFKGAFLVWDTRSYTNKDGKTIEGSLRLYVAGTKIISQLDRLHTKYGLTNREITISRIGKGTSTSYAFDRGDEDKLTRKEIEAMLPDNLKELYDGTAESLYSIVEKAIQASIETETTVAPKVGKSSSDDDYDTEYEDDDESDNDFVEIDEEAEPKKKPAFKKSSAKNSAKTLFKNRKK